MYQETLLQKENQDLRIIQLRKASLSRRNALPQSGSLRLFSRLVIGSISLGFEELNTHLVHWNDQQMKSTENSEVLISNKMKEIQDKDLSIIQTTYRTSNYSPSETSFAIIGMVIDTQNRIQSGVDRLLRIGKLINQVTIPFTKPLNRRLLPKSLRSGFDKLVNRGENELQLWVMTGRNEYIESRRFTQIAMNSAFNESMDGLAQNPEVRELIQSQGVSLAGELVEEIRERTVSADYFLETVARRLLRRKPRAEIPPPSDAVIRSASLRRNYSNR